MFGRMKDPIRGLGTVEHLAPGPSARLSVSVDGMEPYAVALDGGDLKGRWPTVGTMLPIEVDRKKPTRVKVLWDEVPDAPTQAPVAPVVAPGLAAAPAGFPMGQSGMPQINVIGAAPDDPRVQDALRMAEGVMGVDLDGDGVVSPAAPGMQAAASNYAAFAGPEGIVPAPGAADPVERLAQLAELHQEGALTDAEFAQAKAQLLGG